MVNTFAVIAAAGDSPVHSRALAAEQTASVDRSARFRI